MHDVLQIVYFELFLKHNLDGKLFEKIYLIFMK